MKATSTKKPRFAMITRAVVILTSLLLVAGVTGVAVAGNDFPLRSYNLNVIALITLASALVNFCLLFYFAARASRGEDRTWLLFYLAGMSIYTLTYGLQELSVSATGALFWGAMGSISALFAPSLYLFALNYTNQSERRYPGMAVFLLVVGGLILFFESFTNIIFVNSAKYGVLQPWGWDFRSAAGPAIYIFVLWAETLSLSALFRLISFRRHTHNTILRKQSLIFIFAIGITSIGGILLDVLLPSFGVTSLPPFSILLGTPAAMILVYGVLRYKVASISPAMFSDVILGIMEEAVVVTDDQFKVLYTNEKAQDLMGLDPEGKTPRSFEAVLDKDSLPTFRGMFTTHGMTGKIDIPHVNVTPTATRSVPVRVTATQYRMADTPTWVMALTDITKELQVRSVVEHEVQVRTEELHRARSYLVSSIGSLEQGFVLVNAKGDIELANTVAAKLLKSSGDKLIGVPLSAAAAVLLWNVQLAPSVAKVLSGKRSHRLDVAAMDGSFFTTYITPVLADDHVLGAAIIIEDITEQKILDRSKDEFFSIASHELRTPLTAIRGNMSMVKEYYPEAMKDDGLATMVNDTHGASVRLIEIVNDFLDSSKLEQGKMEFSLQPVDLKPLLQSIQKDVQTLLEKRGDKITITDVGKAPMVMADEGRLRQIIYNLVSNAIKYSERATITISTKVDGANLQLRVIDTGKGISPESQKLLFHKFQQTGDPLTRDDTKGTGLGLYISRLLATNMHGNVVLEQSEVGKGSTFMLTLPVATKKAADAAKAAAKL